ILEAKVRELLGEADETTVRVVTAVAGLLAVVAYADRQISDEERAHMRQLLERMHAVPAEHVENIAQLLGQQALHLSATSVPRLTRTLRAELPEEDRFEVLD